MQLTQSGGEVMTGGCNPRKDLSLSRAVAKFYPLKQRYFYTAYLWETKEAMQAAVKGDDAYTAITCHTPYCETFKHTTFGYWLWKISFGLLDFSESILTFTPKLGEIHFYAGGWNQEVVAHECLHASIGLARAHRINPEFVFDGWMGLSEHFKDKYGEKDGIISDEELLCYMHGQLVTEVYKWLWKHDPSDKWKRVVSCS
jgi:hypothetical protein